MTADEHKLMIRMFSMQMLAIRSLVTALKSHGVLETDDLDAYLHVVGFEEMNDPEVSRRVANIYQVLARACGIQIEFQGT
jgi:hypothetical protein